MKSIKLTGFIFAVGFVLISTLAVVYAQEDTTEPATTQTTTTREDKAAEREARIEARKASLQEKLDAKRKEVIEKKCVNAQAKIEAFAARLEASNDKRIGLYERLSTKLGEFVDRFEGRGADTAEIRDGLATLQSMIDDLTIELTSYEDAVRDLADMDCETDPEGFEATLKEARELAQESKAGATELHDYLKKDIRGMFTTMMNAYNEAGGFEGSDAGDDSTETEDETETETETETEDETETEGEQLTEQESEATN